MTDLILQGGRVIDPLHEIDGVADVAISDGKIAAVGANLSTEGATRVLDVRNHVVTPGIIDMHAHVLPWHRRSRLSLDPHVNTFSSGVTTVVDAGTTGWEDFDEMRALTIDRAKIRVLSFINIVGKGMGGDWEHEASEMDAARAAEAARRHADVVVGIKTAHYWARKPFDDAHLPWTAVDRALEAGELCGKPVMVDFFPWLPERPYPTLLEKLRPGDIHTHVFAQQFPVLDEAGKVSDFLFAARERGIIFDLGHGAASFWYRNAAPAIAQGFLPDSISTDLHTGNLNGVVIDMVTTMNKVLAMGVPLPTVIAQSTVAPAREIGHPELGHLGAGGDADVAVFALDQGDFSFVDCGPARLSAQERLRPLLTIRAGQIVYNPHGLGLAEWPDAPPEYWMLR